MPVYKDEQHNSWYCKCNYKDWLGESKSKMKRGFATKREALQWEREFLERQSASMDMKFSSFVEVYFADKAPRLKERSIMTKRVLVETKILPYFGDKKMNEITAVDIIKWQNVLLNQEYKPTYLRMIQNQMTAIFNHAERLYDLKDNPCKKVDKMGRANAKELNFWTKEEYEVFIQGFTESEEMYRIIFQMLFWLGCRVGELLVLTSEDIDLENGTVSISIHMDNGFIISLDCGKWEKDLRTSPNSQGRMDALAIDDPLEYVRLMLSGEMQVWLDAWDDCSV